jgi:hypothetical protein
MVRPNAFALRVGARLSKIAQHKHHIGITSWTRLARFPILRRDAVVHFDPLDRSVENSTCARRSDQRSTDVETRVQTATIRLVDIDRELRARWPSRNRSRADSRSTGTLNTTVNNSPTREESFWPRAIRTIVSLTSAASWCQHVTSSRKLKSVQATCRQRKGELPLLLSCLWTCESGDAGAIPAASTCCVISYSYRKGCVRIGFGVRLGTWCQDPHRSLCPPGSVRPWYASQFLRTNPGVHPGRAMIGAMGAGKNWPHAKFGLAGQLDCDHSHETSANHLR